MRVMRGAMHVIGMIMFFGAGAVLYCATIYYCYQWWGVGWAFGAAFIPPVCEVFPLVMWAKVGLVDSLWYLVVAAIGWLGLIVACVASED